MLTVKQVAEQLQMSPTSGYDLIARGRLVALRLGPRNGAIRIRSEDLESYLTSCRSGMTESVVEPRRVRLRHLHG